MARVVVQVSTQAAAYSSGQSVGGKLKFVNLGNNGAITGVTLHDRAGQNVTYELWLFRADPVEATLSDRTAFAISAAILNVACPPIPIAGFCSGGTGGGISGAYSIYVPYALDGGIDVYGALITRGAPTYVGATDITLAVTTEKLP